MSLLLKLLLPMMLVLLQLLLLQLLLALLKLLVQGRRKLPEGVSLGRDGPQRLSQTARLCLCLGLLLALDLSLGLSLGRESLQLLLSEGTGLDGPVCLLPPGLRLRLQGLVPLRQSRRLAYR